MQSLDKPIDRMDRLVDMAHFPVAVNGGATANVMMTQVITWWLVPRHPQVYAPLVWTAVVLALNLLPVFLLRAISYNTSPVPTLRKMNFYHDQHRFSDWVYLAASANMAFWILVTWTIFTMSHTPFALIAMLAIAFIVTFSPVLLRIFTHQRTVPGEQ